MVAATPFLLRALDRNGDGRIRRDEAPLPSVCEQGHVQSVTAESFADVFVAAGVSEARLAEMEATAQRDITLIEAATPDAGARVASFFEMLGMGLLSILSLFAFLPIMLFTLSPSYAAGTVAHCFESTSRAAQSAFCTTTPAMADHMRELASDTRGFRRTLSEASCVPASTMSALSVPARR